MHRRPKAPLRVRIARSMRRAIRALWGMETRRDFDEWCAAMEHDIARRTWLGHATVG